MDRYYEPQTREILSRDELKRRLNVSFPRRCEQVGAWFLLHTGDAPATEYGQSIAPDTVAIIDGHYTQTYKVVGEAREPEVTTEERLDEIEAALVELAGLMA